jgi:hypothetical protein
MAIFSLEKVKGKVEKKKTKSAQGHAPLRTKGGNVPVA